jgi:uncharacterized OsmC-like protein
MATWFVRDHVIKADEPEEILGSNEAPNPQELLMAALNACMTVGYVAGASKRGIRLDKLEIETKGTLDLRGFFDLDDAVAPGYPALQYVVRIAGDGTPEHLMRSMPRSRPPRPTMTTWLVPSGWRPSWRSKRHRRIAGRHRHPPQRGGPPPKGPVLTSQRTGPNFNLHLFGTLYLTS